MTGLSMPVVPCFCFGEAQYAEQRAANGIIESAAGYPIMWDYPQYRYCYCRDVWKWLSGKLVSPHLRCYCKEIGSIRTALCVDGCSKLLMPCSIWQGKDHTSNDYFITTCESNMWQVLLFSPRKYTYTISFIRFFRLPNKQYRYIWHALNKVNNTFVLISIIDV